jgi:hypothetical protein
MAGPTTSLPANVLHSSGPEVLGSGPGTTPLAEIINAIPQFMAIAATSNLPLDLDEVPLADVEPAWHRRGGRRRTVPGPDHGPASGMQNGHTWTALVLIRIQPETTQIGGDARVSRFRDAHPA